MPDESTTITYLNNPTSGLTGGRVVHYVLPSGEHRPATVIRVCPKEWNYPPGTVQLQVLIDGSNDPDEYKESRGGLAIWRTSVHFSDNPIPGTWHWPERA